MSGTEASASTAEPPTSGEIRNTSTGSSPRAKDAATSTSPVQLTKDDFYILFGVPPADNSGEPESLEGKGDRHSSKAPRWWRVVKGCKTFDPEHNIGVYQNIRFEEVTSQRRYFLYNFIVYGGLVSQLVISAVLILLGANASNHHIAIAVLGSANGVITGILSLIRGQGLPNRLMQYANGLRKIREQIEWMEKEVRAKRREVSYQEAVELRNLYEQTRADAQRNHPDTWTSGLDEKSPKGTKHP
ncbi:hypothetical protein H2201_009061 [Coniosporium apollinis]|uniref:SMODS and SLOG-associating 2TM effector domain-containing protein n=1 Tax=Coniosporium apollinis TaxID=61459 RepID=A0ABQ9NFG0_9PEZI|nr:hypothetical protein H2201_009061 [Coniosporium apollinis]